MMLFWILAGALALFVALLVVWPLLRPVTAPETSLLALDRDITRERLAELEQDHAAGRLSDEAYAGMRAELARALFDASEREPVRHASGGRQRWWAVVLLVSLPLAASVFYQLVLQRPELARWWQLEQDMMPTVEQLAHGRMPKDDMARFTVGDMVHVLQRYLQGQPDNGDGWFMLGVSYLELRMPEQAAEAFERAYRQLPDRVQVKLAYAQALMLSQSGQLTPEARTLIQAVLNEQPNHEGALLMLAAGAFESGELATAQSVLIRLRDLRLAQHGPQDKALAELDRSLAAVTERLRQQQAQGEQTSAPLVVTVKLGPALAAKVRPQDTVFVFARALNGPPMPLAVVRKPASALPLVVSLDDSQAMAPGLRLSAFPDVVVEARISRTGNARATSGDLTAVAVPVKQDGRSHALSLSISEVVP